MYYAFTYSVREFKLHVSGNGKRQVRIFLEKFSLNVFVWYFLSCVERIIMYFSFKTGSSFTLYCLIPYFFILFISTLWLLQAGRILQCSIWKNNLDALINNASTARPATVSTVFGRKPKKTRKILSRLHFTATGYHKYVEPLITKLH
jgi:hypothetical protein